MYRLKDRHIDELKKKKETGMGYQLIEAKVKGQRGIFFVFNCELIVGLEELPDAGYFPSERLDELDTLDDFNFVSLMPLSSLPTQTGGSGGGVPGAPPAGGAPSSGTGLSTPLAPSPRIIRQTVDFEGFARLSAFPKDHRVTSRGGLVSGTYATTVDDLRLVPSGFAAAGRYALPNPAAARYVYLVVPGNGHDIDGGTVRPAHNQAGGGVEVEFVKGVPDGSVFRPYIIPEL